MSKQPVPPCLLQSVDCSHLTYVTHIGSLYQYSQSVCRHLFLSSLLHFCLRYLHRFQPHILLTKHLLCRHSISCHSKDPGRIMNKTSTDLIEVTHVSRTKSGSYPSVLSGKMFFLRPGP